MSPAGPYPTKDMHEILKARVTTLENGGGGAVLDSVDGLANGGERQGISLASTGYAGGNQEVHRLAVTLSSTALKPYVFSELTLYGTIAPGTRIVLEFSDTNTNYPQPQTLSTSDGTIRWERAGDQHFLYLQRPAVLKPGGTLSIAFFDADPIMNTPLAATLLTAAPTGNGVTIRPGLSMTLVDAAGAVIPDKIASVGAMIAERSVYGVLFSDMFPVVATPTADLIGLEIVDTGAGAAKLRYRNAAGVVTEWPGILPQ